MSVGEVTLILVSLLTLTASQLAEINVAMKWLGMANAVHLDETTPEDLAGEVVPNLDTINQGSFETLVLLRSPQNLTANKALCDALIHCHDPRILRLLSVCLQHIVFIICNCSCPRPDGKK